MNAEQNLQLLQEIESNRRFMLMAYQQNPDLLAVAEPRIRQLFGLPSEEGGSPSLSRQQDQG